MLSDIERLAVEQALYKVIAEDVGTRNPGNLRDQVNQHYLELYEMTGATGFEVRIAGQKVGTYGFSKTRAQPARKESTVEVVDARALREWDSDDFNDYISRWIDGNLATLAASYFEETGDLPDGMTVIEVDVPAQPAGIRPNGTLRINPAKVAEALGNQLPSTVAGLLEGGDA